MAIKPPAQARQVDPETLRAGKVIEMFRLRVGVTQEIAAEAADPPMSKQYWGMHETGRVPGIFKPGVQRRLIEALNTLRPEGMPPFTLDDVAAALSDDGETTSARMTRMARELGGQERNDRHADAGLREAVFPTRDGPVTFRYPDRLTSEGLKDLEAYFAVFLRAGALGPASEK